MAYFEYLGLDVIDTLVNGSAVYLPHKVFQLLQKFFSYLKKTSESCGFLNQNPRNQHTQQPRPKNTVNVHQIIQLTRTIARPRILNGNYW